jgi:hypothetical protein
MLIPVTAGAPRKVVDHKATDKGSYYACDYSQYYPAGVRAWHDELGQHPGDKPHHDPG